jgi:hypothetical protein
MKRGHPLKTNFAFEKVENKLCIVFCVMQTGRQMSLGLARHSPWTTGAHTVQSRHLAKSPLKLPSRTVEQKLQMLWPSWKFLLVLVVVGPRPLLAPLVLCLFDVVECTPGALSVRCGGGLNRLSCSKRLGLGWLCL